ncbi:tetratricopeptide repeat protein 38-like [Ptychodera flava]|uniref:tetratricopeptide repeat protein 38-like n=1 Tax=Ptychodera flava TaxID=63121 RepID=UPI00396A1FB1
MNYKDCQEWKKVGFPLSTTSNEAAKMYDAAVTQYMRGYSDDSVGDIGTCLRKMFMADPEFVLGHAFKNGLMLLGGGASVRTNSDLKNNIDKMVTMAKKADVNPLEKLHVEAVKLYSAGNIRSLYAFGLEETNFYDEAEKIAREVLEVSPEDGQATHTIAHVMEMMNRYEEGVTFHKARREILRYAE